MKKRVTALFLSVIMVLSVTGCSLSDNVLSRNKEPKQDKNIRTVEEEDYNAHLEEVKEKDKRKKEEQELWQDNDANTFSTTHEPVFSINTTEGENNYRADFYQDTPTTYRVDVQCAYENYRAGNNIPKDLFYFFKATNDQHYIDVDTWSDILKETIECRGSFGIVYFLLYMYGDWNAPEKENEDTVLLMIGSSRDGGGLWLDVVRNNDFVAESYKITQIYFDIDSNKPVSRTLIHGDLSEDDARLLDSFVTSKQSSIYCYEFDEILNIIVENDNLNAGLDLCKRYMGNNTDTNKADRQDFSETETIRIGPYYDNYLSHYQYVADFRFFPDNNAAFVTLMSTPENKDVEKSITINSACFKAITSDLAKDIPDNEWGSLLYYLGINHSSYVEAYLADLQGLIDFTNMVLIAPAQNRYGFYYLDLGEDYYSIDYLEYKSTEGYIKRNEIKVDATKSELNDLKAVLYDTHYALQMGDSKNLIKGESYYSEIMQTLLKEGIDSTIEKCLEIQNELNM